jgi:exopolysaccharide biosynthesis WecB/TagA/CpsF family protein
MIDRGKKNVLGILVDEIDYEAAVAKVITAARARKSYSVSALAVHGVMTGVFDPIHRYRLNQLDLVTPDGQPVRWAINWLYRTHLTDRVYGPKLMLKICEQAQSESLPIFLFGSRTDVIEALKINLQKMFPNLQVAGSEPSRFRRASIQEKGELVQRIRASGAAITFVGLGCPRQEVWVYETRDELSMPLIAIGAAYDFIAGLVAQAPEELQKVGLEWLFRLSHEPVRLWKRYLFLNPVFLYLLILQKMAIINFQGSTGIRPKEELRYL